MGELVDSVSKGRQQGLEALRGVLAGAIAKDDGRNTASLARQLREVLRELDEIARAQGRKGSLVDELADRRKARGADAEGGAGSRVDKKLGS